MEIRRIEIRGRIFLPKEMYFEIYNCVWSGEKINFLSDICLEDLLRKVYSMQGYKEDAVIFPSRLRYLQRNLLRHFFPVRVEKDKRICIPSELLKIAGISEGDKVEIKGDSCCFYINNSPARI